MAKKTKKVEDKEMRALKKNWGWFLALGILLIVLGILAIVVPYIPGLAIVLMLAIVIAASGVGHLINAFRCRKWKDIVFNVLVGVLYVLAGLILFSRPGIGLAGLTLLIAILLIMEGVLVLTQAFRMPKKSNKGWMFFSGIIAILLGIFIGAEWPVSALWFIGTIIGINMIIKGWSTLWLAVAIRQA
jgi:uncharacterized membrane protein HdeD (DUF308 family)